MLRRYAFKSPEYQAVLKLRYRVLREPLGLTYSQSDLDAEAGEIFFAEWQEDALSGCLQVRDLGTGTWKMRQVAVLPELQGRGIGKRMVQGCESWLRAHGALELELHARQGAVPFYESVGYKLIGEPFVEVGIPHRKMQKQLFRFDLQKQFPTDAMASIDAGAPAILPIGALEWHGDHLPLGLDSLVARSFAGDLAERVNGLLFPTLELPITTLPHRLRLCYPAELVAKILDETLNQISKMGFRVVLLVSGHYAQGHEWELYEAAGRAPAGLKVLAASPLEVLEEDELLDHAGTWEAACFAWHHPKSDRLSYLPPGALRPRQNGVLGGDPRLADPEMGWDVMQRALERWRELAVGPQTEIDQFYQMRRASYQDYKGRFFTDSWEQAIQAWWSSQD